MNTKQLAEFASDAGQAAALVSYSIATIAQSQLLTMLRGSQVVLGACCDRMALCTFRRDLHPCGLLRRPFFDIAQLCIISSFCGMYDWSVRYTGLAPGYTW